MDVCDDREQLIAYYDEEGVPQCGDGMSASSDESETTSGSYKNDLEAECGPPAFQLQVVLRLYLRSSFMMLVSR